VLVVTAAVLDTVVVVAVLALAFELPHAVSVRAMAHTAMTHAVTAGRRTRATCGEPGDPPGTDDIISAHPLAHVPRRCPTDELPRTLPDPNPLVAASHRCYRRRSGRRKNA
jgi:hypothetical protein